MLDFSKDSGTSLSHRWAIVQLAGRRILAPIIKVRVLVAQPQVTVSPSSSRPRTAAFHAVNGGSNPPGDAKEIQGLRVKSKSFFRIWGISAVLRQRTGQSAFQGSFRVVFPSLSAKDTDTQAVVFKIPKSVCSSLYEFHFSVKSFGYPIVF